MTIIEEIIEMIIVGTTITATSLAGSATLKWPLLIVAALASLAPCVQLEMHGATVKSSGVSMVR